MPAEKSSLLLFYLFADSSVKIFGAKFGLLSFIKLAKPFPTTALKASVFEVILVCIFSTFFRIRTGYGEIRNISVFISNAGKCGKNADQNNSKYGNFLRSERECSVIFYRFDYKKSISCAAAPV